MSRLKRQQMQARLKREINKLHMSGVPKQPSRKLLRLAKLYNVPVGKYHFGTGINKKF